MAGDDEFRGRIVAFDYDGRGAPDHILSYRPGFGSVCIAKNKNGILLPAYTELHNGIGGYDFRSSRDRACAFDYTSSGKLDHLVLYRPGSGTIYIVGKKDGSFVPVYKERRHGIGGYDLHSPRDRILAFDYDGSGKLDHLVLYRPGAGIVYVVGKKNGNFAPVYTEHRHGFGSYDLRSTHDRVFAFDYHNSGKLDHLVLYRRGAGTIYIVKNNNGAFTTVYSRVAKGFGGYLLSPADRAFAFDYEESGKLSSLALYRPGNASIWILGNVGNGFLPVYGQGGGGDMQRDLQAVADAPFELGEESPGAAGTGPNHLLLHRSNTGIIWVLKYGGHSFVPSLWPDALPGNARLFPSSSRFARAIGDALGSSERDANVLPSERFPLRDRPSWDGTVAAVESPQVREDVKPPEFVLNLSNIELAGWTQPRVEIHGSYLVSRPDVMLFGPNHLVDRAGLWSCETRTYKRQYIELVTTPAFCGMYPGARPEIQFEDDRVFLDCGQLRSGDIESLHEPVFLATPLEADNWGRWLATTVPKTVQFKAFGYGRKFLCRAAHPWQRNFLRLLGVADSHLLEHDPGKTYFCPDAVTIEYSTTDMSVSDAEKQIYADLAQVCQRDTPDHFGERIFVSRLLYSEKHPGYRVLQNEPELITALARFGFKAVQPELLSIVEQIGLFARARCVVALGGAALFSVRFCRPGTSVVTIESSDYFIRGHSMLLSSMGHRFGVIFGRQDQADPTPIHKRWTIDVRRAIAAIREIL